MKYSLILIFFISLFIIKPIKAENSEVERYLITCNKMGKFRVCANVKKQYHEIDEITIQPVSYDNDKKVEYNFTIQKDVVPFIKYKVKLKNTSPNDISSLIIRVKVNGYDGSSSILASSIYYTLFINNSGVLKVYTRNLKAYGIRIGLDTHDSCSIKETNDYCY